MSDNTIAKVLKVLGILIMILGILISLILGQSSESLLITIVGSVSSIISGLLFLGFSEVIHLLQNSSDQQAAILDLLSHDSGYNAGSAVEDTANRPSEAAPAFEKTRKDTEPTASVPRKALVGDQGKIICPACGKEQRSDRTVCLSCGQPFINGRSDVPYWCGICGTKGPYDMVCPNCGSTAKVFNR